MVTALIFGVSSLIAIAAAIEVFRVNSMARATYSLAISFIAVGVVVLLFDLDYIGIIIILMMVMEMAIMAVFMIMFMGMNPALMAMDMTHHKRPSVLISLIVFLILAAAAILIPWPSREGSPASDLTDSLGHAIMGSKMLVMLTVSPVLFATIVSALVIANPRGRYDRLGDNLDRPVPDDPHGGGLGR